MIFKVLFGRGQMVYSYKSVFVPPNASNSPTKTTFISFGPTVGGRERDAHTKDTLPLRDMQSHSRVRRHDHQRAIKQYLSIRLSGSCNLALSLTIGGERGTFG